MARPGINYETVKAAAIDLLGEGQHPSIQRIREMLGTGSNSTIAQHLKSWQQELAKAPQTALPPAVPEAVMSAVEQFWRVAMAQAEARFQTLRDELGQKVTAAESTRDEALASKQQAQEEITTLERALANAEAASKALEDRLLTEQERRTAVEELLKVTDRRLNEAKSVTERLREDHQIDMHKMELRLDKSREDTERRISEAEQRLRQERERGESNETRLMHILDQNRVEHIQERQTFNKERNIWKEREAEFQSQLETLQVEIGRTRVANATAEKQIQQIEQELANTRSTLEELRACHLASVRTEESLRGELKALSAEHQTLLKTLAVQAK